MTDLSGLDGERLRSVGLNTLAHSVQAGLYVVVIKRIYNKHSHSMEPLHVYELNNLCNWALLALFNIFTVFDVFFDKSELFCSIVHFGLYYVIFSFYVGIIITQIDRFLALYWNVKYTTRVTKDDALKTVGISKAVLFIITLVVVNLDGQILECFSSTFFGCRMLKSFMWVNFPMFFTLITVIVVSIYVLHTIKKHAMKVAPVVNINTISEVVRNEEILTAEDLPDGHVDDGGKKIKRRDTDPYMFYREKQSETETTAVKVAFKRLETSIFEPAKRAFKINMLTLFLLIMMVPHNLLNVYFYFSSEICTNNIVKISRFVGFTQYIFVIMYPFILMTKLNKCSS